MRYHLTAALRTATLPVPKGGRWPMRLTVAVHDFIKSVEEAHPGTNTAKTYQSQLRRLPAFATRDAVTEMGEPLVRAFFAQLVAARRSPNTLRGAASALREFCRWGLQQGYWATHPMDAQRFRYRKPDGVPKPFDDDEIARLMAVPLPAIERVARDVFYFTGMRVSPLVTLRCCDVSFAQVRIGALEAAGTLRTLNKGNKVMQVYIVPDLKPTLEAWLATRQAKGARPYDPLFPAPMGHAAAPVSRSTVWRWVKRWAKAAEVLDGHPHRFRHTYATDLLRRGATLEQVQKLLGHASIHTTQVYTKVADAAVLGAALLVRRPGGYLAPPSAQPLPAEPSDNTAGSSAHQNVGYVAPGQPEAETVSNIIWLADRTRPRRIPRQQPRD